MRATAIEIWNRAEGEQSRTRAPLNRRLTSFGSSADNGVVLADTEVPAYAFHVEVTPDGHVLHAASSASIRVNGQRRRHASLAVGDLIEVGQSCIRLGAAELALAPTRLPSQPEGAATFGGGARLDEETLRQLFAFVESLLEQESVEKLLETMMDQVVALSKADKGVLLVFDGGRLVVKVARNVARQNIAGAMERLSDSIIARVVETRRSALVSNALTDEHFKDSASIINLKLSSVMCAPMMTGEELLGIVYVGNDRFVDHFDAQRLALLELWAGLAALVMRRAAAADALRDDNEALRRQLDERKFGALIGACGGMREVFKRIERIAPTDISVLIEGETGTGKELIARELHKRSRRGEGPFVTINCGAIPGELLESELFGSVRGAFTSASSTRDGLFQAASGGTLFLDEIGEMPLALQVKLLRALQEREVFKVGSTQPETIDIRVLAATHRDLQREIAQGRFRQDLYYRLNVAGIVLPPLRERGDDIEVLARALLAKHQRSLNPTVEGFSQEALAALRRHSWPGNVRELEARVQKALVLSENRLISPADLELEEPLAEMSSRAVGPLTLAQAKDEFQRRFIAEALARNEGNRTRAAKELGVDPRTVFRFLEREESASSGEVASEDDA